MGVGCGVGVGVGVSVIVGCELGGVDVKSGI